MLRQTNIVPLGQAQPLRGDSASRRPKTHDKFYWVLNVDNINQEHFEKKVDAARVQSVVDCRRVNVFNYPNFMHKSAHFFLQNRHVLYVSISSLLHETYEYSSFRNNADLFFRTNPKRVLLIRSNSDMDNTMLKIAKAALGRRGYIEGAVI